MCSITQDRAIELVRNIKSIENGDKMTPKQLGEFLAQLKVLQEDIELAEKKAKKILIEKGIVPMYFPDLQRKVLLSEGKEMTEYPVRDTLEALKKEGLEDHMLDIVKIQKNLLENMDKKVQDVVATISTTKIGEPYITVSKMNKKELVEHARVSFPLRGLVISGKGIRRKK